MSELLEIFFNKINLEGNLFGEAWIFMYIYRKLHFLKYFTTIKLLIQEKFYNFFLYKIKFTII